MVLVRIATEQNLLRAAVARPRDFHTRMLRDDIEKVAVMEIDHCRNLGISLVATWRRFFEHKPWRLQE
jgi:hypothetical protein